MGKNRDGLITFDAGKTYTISHIGDSCLFTSYKVVRRTAKSVWVTNCDHNDERKVCRRSITIWNGCEQFKPHGSYSMCQIVRATEIDGKAQERAKNYNKPYPIDRKHLL